jgi:hypothetical protein
MAIEAANNWRALSKRNAFLIHLALSLLVFMTLVAVMVTLWFPGELFFLDGGWQVLKLVALVDIVLGPALTLMLWRPRKPDLVLDMSLVAVIQVAALGYGFVTAYQQRTLALVFAENNFNTLSNAAYEVSNENLIERNLTPQSIKALDDRIPAILTLPKPPGGSAKYMQDLLNGFPQQHERSDLFVPAAENYDTISDYVVTKDMLAAENATELVQVALDKQANPDNINVYRFNARYGSGFALYDHNTAKIVDYIKIDRTSAKTTVAESPE